MERKNGKNGGHEEILLQKFDVLEKTLRNMECGTLLIYPLT